MPTWYEPAIGDATAAYRACYWASDENRNLAWIQALNRLLEKAAEPLAARIAASHAISWPVDPIPVDVVQYVSFEGANTVIGPDHILVSSVASGNTGFGALEVLFHEASHTVLSPRGGGSINALKAAADKQGIELPRDAWHVVLFFVAGHHTEQVVQKIWGEPYEMYMKSQGVMADAWPTYAAPLETFWRPYLEGEMTLQEAAEGLVAAVASPGSPRE